MSDVERYTDISTIEVLAAGQGIRYTYTGGIMTFHDKAGDKTFNWLEHSGIKNTLTWLEERKRASKVSDLQNISEHLQLQYTNLYGPFYPHGEYHIGDTIAIPGISGEIIWMYLSAGQGLTYVVDAGQGEFPEECAAAKVQGRVSPWK